MSLGSRINDIRKVKGMSIDELSVQSGVPKGTLSKITAGITTSPTLDTVKAIAKALECHLDDFDDDLDTKKSPGTDGSAPEDELHSEIIGLLSGLDDSQKDFLAVILETVVARNRQRRQAAPASTPEAVPVSEHLDQT